MTDLIKDRFEKMFKELSKKIDSFDPNKNEDAEIIQSRFNNLKTNLDNLVMSMNHEQTFGWAKKDNPVKDYMASTIEETHQYLDGIKNNFETNNKNYLETLTTLKTDIETILQQVDDIVKQISKEAERKEKELDQKAELKLIKEKEWAIERLKLLSGITKTFRWSYPAIAIILIYSLLICLSTVYEKVHNPIKDYVFSKIEVDEYKRKIQDLEKENHDLKISLNDLKRGK